MKVLVAQTCLTLCDPMDCSPPDSVHGILQARNWGGFPFPPPGDLPHPGIDPRFPALQADSLPSEPPGKWEKKSHSKIAIKEWEANDTDKNHNNIASIYLYKHWFASVLHTD